MVMLEVVRTEFSGAVQTGDGVLLTDPGLILFPVSRILCRTIRIRYHLAYSMNDELLEQRFHLPPSGQNETIRAMCRDIEHGIRTAASRSDAEALIERTCADFDIVCESDIIREQLRLYLAALLRRYW